MAVWWVTRQLKQEYRRHSYLTENTRHTKKWLEWLQYEAQQVDDLLHFVKRRVDNAPQENEHKYYREWLDDQLRRIKKHRISFDMDQDYLMINESYE